MKIDKQAIKFNLTKQAPNIYTGIAIVSLITMGLLISNEAPKAERERIDTLKEKQKTDPKAKLTVKENAVIIAKNYYPSWIMGGLSITAMIFSNREYARRNVALATAYGITQASLSELREEMKKQLGDKKYSEIREVQTKNAIEDALEKNGNTVVDTGDGNVLCYDDWSGRTFYSSVVKIDKAQNAINERLVHGEMFIPINDLYYELGLENIESGRDLGWDTDHFLEIEKIWTHVGDKPALGISFDPSDRYYSFRR